MKKLSVLFGALAVLLSDVMCAVVAYNYCNLLWGGRYAGYGVSICRPLWYRHHRLCCFGACVQKKGR